MAICRCLTIPVCLLAAALLTACSGGKAGGSNPQAVSGPPADLAPFAALVASDPDRDDGTLATRAQPIPACDLLLTTPLPAQAAAPFQVSLDAQGRATFGLEWLEPKALRRAALVFASAADLPDPASCTFQFWSGASSWQGSWQTAKGVLATGDHTLEIRLDPAQAPLLAPGTEKVRWIVSGRKQPLAVAQMIAETASSATRTTLHLTGTGLAGRSARIEVFNGALAGGNSLQWQMDTPLALDCTWFSAAADRGDRTVLRFTLADQAFGVAVDDLVSNGQVYVPRAGLFLSTSAAAGAFAAYQASLTGRQTTLDQVRALPDQTFDQAMSHVHHAVQDLGPMILSLACDDRKFQVEREGTITYERFTGPDQWPGLPTDYHLQMKVAVGSGAALPLTRSLQGDWLPVPVIEQDEDGMIYRQRTLVATLDEAPLSPVNYPIYGNAFCWSELTASNGTAGPRPAHLGLTFLADRARLAGARISAGGPPWVVTAADGQLLAVVFGTGLLPGLDGSGSLTLDATLDPGASTSLRVWLPGTSTSAAGPFQDLDGAALLARVQNHWNQALAGMAVIATPDPTLTRLIRASLVNCLLAARVESAGRVIEPWVSSAYYGPLESEGHSVIRGMDLMGGQDFARRSLDYFLQHYAPEGYLGGGYTLMGTGWHLWTLAQYVQRNGDSAWLQANREQVAKAVAWVAGQCEATSQTPDPGLMPPTVAADWERFGFRAVQEGHYYAGLSQAAAALGGVGLAMGPTLARADAFKTAILAQYHATQAASPVLALADGTWVRGYPSMVDRPGLMEDLFPAEDSGRVRAYDVELGAHHLALLGVLDPASDEVTEMLNHMEDYWFLQGGLGDYAPFKNHADWFNLGGFAKIQPYYARNAELYALRDDIKPFIRSYFNTIPALVSLETLAFWENFNIGGAWNKTHETGYFLAQTRTIFVQERGGELWLAPFVPEQWWAGSSVISASNLPSDFGRVGFTITPDAGARRIAIAIQPPTRSLPGSVVLRVRPPGGLRAAGVAVAGASSFQVDEAESVIRMLPGSGPLAVAVTY